MEEGFFRARYALNKFATHMVKRMVEENCEVLDMLAEVKEQMAFIAYPSDLSSVDLYQSALARRWFEDGCHVDISVSDAFRRDERYHVLVELKYCREGSISL